MKQFNVLFFLLFFASSIQAQSLYVENGISISHLNKMYDENVFRYGLEVGLNYAEHDWFFLSSGIGFQQLGGAYSYQQIENINNAVKMKENAFVRYVSLNTLMNFKWEHEKWLCYLGVGPSLFINVDDDRFKNYSEAKSIVVGLKTTIGARYKFNRMWIGANFNYQPCFGDLLDAESKVTSCGVTISIGYFFISH